MATFTLSNCDYASTSSNPIYDQYDVFLSFRGLDTRHSFTDHLYDHLKRAAIPTFRDNNELEGGESLKEQLEKAIKQSSVSIIVFSQNYASSSWCLDEVVRILEQKKIRHHKVIPIFYHVAASDVRHQRGSYEEALNRHKEKGDVSLERIEAWMAALTEAANLVGLSLNDGSETEFIGRILSEVRKSLPNRKALNVPKHLVGMNYWTDGINLWFKDRSEDNKVLLIWGIGGIGKTTIAKHFFNKYSEDFDCSCFLARITAIWDKTEVGLCGLQSTLLSNILNEQREKTPICNSEEGTKNIKRAICNKKVLIVLDDVNETELLYALLGHPQKFCPGSKIIVTSRNMSLQKDFTIHPMAYNVQALSNEDSLELFSWHAFRQCHPLEEYEQLSEEILIRCEGLPLALEVLGSSLRNKLDTVFWKKQLQKWNEIVNPGIQKVMQISYDSLEDDMVKNLFLHVACFFVGEEEYFVVNILDHCGLHAIVGIQNLIDRCLITRYDGKLIMHQVIQDMGREIVRQESPNQPGKRSRLWYHADSFSVLKYDKGTEAIEGLILDGQKINKVESDGSSFSDGDANPHLIIKLLGYVKKKKGDLNIDAFTKMVNIKLVKLNCVHLTGRFHKFPKEVRWMSWHGCPLEYVPMELPQQNLVALEMERSLLKLVWKGYMEVKSLKFLSLSYSLKFHQTPDFRGLPQLERLILRGCSNLVKVCKTIGILKRLVLLDLRDCRSLRDLPGLPESIVTLELSGCNLDEFSREQKDTEPIFDWFRIIKFAAPRIDTGPIKLLAYLPHSLVMLNLEDCNLSNECFPRDFSSLSFLRDLDLSGNLITRLPDCIKNLSNSRLVQLRISSCPQLHSVIHAPSTLKFLIISKNKHLEKAKVRVSSITSVLEIDESTGYFEVEGCLKQVHAWNVDRKVIKNLGLESVLIGCEAKVIYEYGIFSTFVDCREIPRCFTTNSITSRGKDVMISSKRISSYSYFVPSLAKKIQGLNICVALKHNPEQTYSSLNSVNVCLTHKRMDLKWIYRSVDRFEDEKKTIKDVLWVSAWKCEDLLEVGDEVQVHIEVKNSLKYEVECGIRTLYEDFIDDKIITPFQEEDEEDTDTLRWTDKTNVAFSNYSIPGTTLILLNSNPFNRFPCLLSQQDKERQVQSVDWWGLRSSEKLSNNHVVISRKRTAWDKHDVELLSGRQMYASSKYLSDRDDPIEQVYVLRSDKVSGKGIAINELITEQPGYML